MQTHTCTHEQNMINVKQILYTKLFFLYLYFLLSKNLTITIYRTIILPVLLCECETRSFTLREEHRLRVFENRVTRRLFGPKRDEVTGEEGRPHKDRLNHFYTSLWLFG